ncbi:Alpha-glucosidase, glycosyl hydrolase family GH31 [Mucilaginibacter gossypiicola]|uniref:Alpha-glucosidase, glycosyl hydrolase family GH31 n=1 Tax=Mucilaginibacter gossypiicola TaxID=551995 RepID=A0A1H8I8F8_9SPHI|nr:TIM-barrel domain-containing protein [Mucilaginibacter gossypiicola]SEN64497.1 Alpha-glucosidase, glycosyl hydrolase family GH31 [Mucilaginibacter gossypiicola]
MKKVSLFLAFVLLGVVNAFAQTGIGSNKSGYKKQGNTLYFNNANGDVKIEFCSPSMFRVRASWSRKFAPDEHLMQENYKWPAVDYKVTDAQSAYIIQTSALIITVLKSPFIINVADSKGVMLSSEYVPNGKQNGGLHHIGDTVMCTKDLLPDEHFFGFGERMDFTDQRNKLVKLNVGRGKSKNNLLGAYNINEANYCPVPFFMSTKGYGIYLHNSSATEWDMGSKTDDEYSFKANDGELDYYFIYGPTFPAILNSYLSITGKSPLLPRFAFGLHMGTYSGGTWGHEELTSDKYVIELARKMREMGIPVDILFLDSTWRLFGKNGGKGATTFEWRETFKDPKAMFDSLYAMNFKMVGLHIRPRFDNAKNLNLLDQAQAKGFTYPENGKPGEFVNFFDQQAANWWWDNGVMKVASIGAKFLKTDEGSAFGSLANESEKVGPTGKEITQLHNVFPIAYAKAPYLKFQEYNGIRGLNQTREGYSGIQRYPFIFAGDWPSEWQYFAPVIKAGLNIGMSGVGYWAHCMGGFEHAADPELYMRWVQFGMFSPVAMVFGMDHPGYKEPWNYGAEALANFKKYDDLRYRLIPYIYSNAYTQYQTGMPLMRALVLEYQDDPNTYNIADQYLFGDNMMVCPVTVKGAQTRTIYLPKGVWFDYWTGEKYTGKQYIHILTPADHLPIFVKAGSIIPMQPAMKYMDEKPVDVITLDVFPGQASEFKLYEDDGICLKYQQGGKGITQIAIAEAAGGWELQIKKPVGSFIPAPHTYLAKMHWPHDQEPSLITENNQALKATDSADALAKTAGWYYDKTTHLLWIKTLHSNHEDITLSVK